MDSKLIGDVSVTFIRGGLSKKNTPYLQISNGRSEMFVTVDKDFDHTIFEGYNEDDLITLRVSQTVGSDQVTLLDVIS